jgi:hypothetical protein
MNVAAVALAAGRNCPIDYVYAPTVFDRTPELEAAVLYAVGGLYGNLAALDSIERLAEAERVPVTVVFNGDFHWFDADPRWFSEIERRVAPYSALRGNVETEIARDSDVGAGCGCAYPPDVDDGVVRRSNQILRDLQLASSPAARRRLARLPMHVVAQVGALRVGVVHGDAASLAGWRFAHNALDHPWRRAWFDDVRRAANIDVFASTHTCLAALRDFRLPGGRLTVINNGAAGMPNFSATRHGLISRIAVSPSPHRPVFGIERDGVHIDALAVDYDHGAFLDRFLARWPSRSAAYLSYFSRIMDGPDHTVARAVG